jgi:hypothetical protein
MFMCGFGMVVWKQSKERGKSHCQAHNARPHPQSHHTRTSLQVLPYSVTGHPRGRMKPTSGYLISISAEVIVGYTHPQEPLPRRFQSQVCLC